MRVLMINYEFPPLGGGTGIANKYLLKELKNKKNLKVDVLTSSIDKYEKESFSKNIRIIKLDISKNGQNIHHQTSINLISFFVKSIVFTLKNRQKYDLIHAFSGLPGGVTALFSGKSYIVSLRGTEVPGYEARLNWLSQIIKPLIKLSWKKAKIVDANSQYLKKLALKVLPGLKIKVIPNGVDVKKFYPAKKMPDKPIILCNARLGKRKGVEYLIQAMPKVLSKIPKAKLVLVGEGEEKAKLKRLAKELNIAEKISFLGGIEHKKLPVIYRKSSLFVLPSLSESLSNSLLEALASGLPVVVSKVGGNPELVGKKNGVLVPSANSKALVIAIVRLLKDKKLRQEMGETSRKMAVQYSWKQAAAKYCKLYF